MQNEQARPLRGSSIEEAAATKIFSHMTPGAFYVRAELETLLGQARDVAKGASHYVENWECEGVTGGDSAFAAACLGLIGFVLDAIDAHLCAVNEQPEAERDYRKMKFTTTEKQAFQLVKDRR